MLFVARLQEFGKPPVAVLRVCIQMTLTPSQACGSQTSLVKVGKPNKHIDHVGISRRFQEFSDAASNKPYQRQKSALERQLSDFLASFPSEVRFFLYFGNVIKFLISRDKTGRTVVHTQSCLRVSCSCPSRLAAGSVDSLVGKLKAIFNNIGLAVHAILTL